MCVVVSYLGRGVASDAPTSEVPVETSKFLRRTNKKRTLSQEPPHEKTRNLLSTKQPNRQTSASTSGPKVTLSVPELSSTTSNEAFVYPSRILCYVQQPYADGGVRPTESCISVIHCRAWTIPLRHRSHCFQVVSVPISETRLHSMV